MKKKRAGMGMHLQDSWSHDTTSLTFAKVQQTGMTVLAGCGPFFCYIFRKRQRQGKGF